MDSYQEIHENDFSKNVKIKNENFICATSKSGNLQLDKLILGNLRLKSTKEFFAIRGPCTVYRTSNNFSSKQEYFLDKYKTNFF